jgi:glycosyltransferase involved in cell wall biosynthesis
MPVFNERATVGAAVDELLGAELGVDGGELVLVDDGSTGGTRELLRNGNWPESVQMHLGDRNGGKGAEVRTGLGLASGRYATVLDADLEYRAEAIRDLLATVAAEKPTPPSASGAPGHARPTAGTSPATGSWRSLRAHCSTAGSRTS